jgi:hypothetical protein
MSASQVSQRFVPRSKKATMVEPTMTDSRAKTADPCEAGSQVALESEVPVLQVAYDVVEGGGDSTEDSDASNRKYKWIAAFIVGAVTTTAALGLYAIFKSGGSGHGEDTRTRGKPSSLSPSLPIEWTSMPDSVHLPDPQ